MRYLFRILKFTKELWRYYVLISIFTIILALMSQLQPLFLKAVVDQITKIISGGHIDTKIVALFAALIFLTDFGQTIFSNIGGYLGDTMSAKITETLSNRYYKHLLSLPQQYFDTELTGTIINRMNRGINQIGNFVQVLSNNFLQFVFSTILSLAIVAYYSWPVAIMLATLYPIFIWMTTRTSTTWQKYQKDINKNTDIASGRFAESIGQVKIVKSYIAETRELKFFDRYMKKTVDITHPQSRYWHMQDVRRRLVLNIIFFAIYVFIFTETAKGNYTLGVMVLLIQYSTLIRIPIFSISFIVDGFQRAIANTKDYFDAMDVKPEIIDQPGATILNIKQGKIEYKNVEFGYGQQKVLHKVSFIVEPDTKIAFVGESGEGKTTIISLLMRLYELDKGNILIDGQDIKYVTQKSLRQSVGVVFQDPALFSGSIQENIAYARPSASFDEIKKAAKDANADEFIEKLKDGYSAQIGERGLKLSGGQKQRIAIARAFLKNAPILVLDEATSSLDSKSEAMVQQALVKLMKDRTTLIIAHRLSTIQHVDKIITIRNGEVDEIGTPQDLAQTNGIYARLLKLQSGNTTVAKKTFKDFDISK